MRPYISNKPLRRLSIPKFSGGVNYRDGISQILDNQLTDCNGVWFRNGVVQTRPGIRCSENLNNFEQDFAPYSEDDVLRVYAKKENFKIEDGVRYQLVVFQYPDKLEVRYYSDIDSYINVATITEVPKGNFTCNVFQHNAEIYIFCSGYYGEEENPFYIFKISGTGNVHRVTSEDVYIPTIMTNALPTEALIDTPQEQIQHGATYLEGYNLLGNKYKIIYSTAKEYQSPNETTEPIKSDTMNYMLFFSAKDFIGEKVTAEITDINGVVHTHEVIISGEEITTETEDRGDGRYLNVQKKRIYFTDASGSVALESRADFLRNNMVVTAPCPNSKENYEKVLNMTKNEWFGGTSEGIYGGIHLFMCGNTKEGEKSLVCWSDFEKPLYFSENGCAYVGDKAQRSTTFGKQGNSLMIFKESELYATQYSSLSSPMDADAVTNQQIVDIAASEVTFPMTQVHGFIGCDCPDTVQLCRNRLVWANSDGKVYTLTSASQWSERSVYEVSGMVEPVLKKLGSDSLKNALSADFDGYYVLSAGDKFLLMDYNSYGYSNVYSYAKSEDAQMYIPWWVWEKPSYTHRTYHFDIIESRRHYEDVQRHIDIRNMVVFGDNLYLTCFFDAQIVKSNNTEQRFIFENLKVDGNEDLTPYISFETKGEERVIKRETAHKDVSAMMQTKLFDFGDPTIQKAVPKAEVSFGNNDGYVIEITTITDRGESSEAVWLNLEEVEKRDPKFFQSVAVRNAQKLNNRIGYRFQSDGNIVVDAMTVYFKYLGGSK